MITGVGSVAVLVSDAQKSAEWYQTKLGFEVTAQGHWVTVRPKGSGTAIHLCGRCEEWESDKPGGNTGISFLSDDKTKTYQELKARGVEFKQDLTTEWFGTYAIFKDLDGNEFWI